MRRRWGMLLGGALVAVTLTACAAPVTSGPETVEPIDVTVAKRSVGTVLPPGAESVATVAVDGMPRAVDNVFVGSLFPGGDRSDLAFVGFDAEGTRWSLSTNPTCAGWAATRAEDGTALVIALNSDAGVSDGSLAENTLASAFVAATGEERWSNTPVIGPIIANGMLFNGVQKAILSAEPGDTQTLTPSTGLPLSLPDALSDARVLHEHFGVVLVTLGDQLAAIDSASETVRWTALSPGEFVPESSVGHALAFRNHSGEIIVTHLTTGEILAPAVRTLRAATSADGASTAIVTSAGTGATAHLLTAAGTQWSVAAAENVRPVSVGAGRVYLEADDTGIVLAEDDGAELHRGEFQVPVTVTTSGHGLVRAGMPRQYEMVRLDSD